MKYPKETHPPKRYNTPGHAHTLTFSCYKNRTFLKSKIVCGILADSINAARIYYKFDVWAYVFMPNHVHLLIFPFEEEYSISDVLKSIKQSSSQAVIAHLKENNPKAIKYLETGLKKPKLKFWQDGGGYDRNFWSREKLIVQVNYIHENPLRKELVENPEDWYWSSAAYWTKGIAGPVKIYTDKFPMT